MNKRVGRTLFFLSVGLFGSYFSGFGQIATTASGISTSTNKGFDALVTKIEGQSRYQFYYDKTQTDSLDVNIDSQGKTIKDILTQVFAGTEFRFSIDQENRVFVSKSMPFQTELPFQFFERSVAASDANQVPQYLETTKVVKLKAAAESKLYAVGRKTDLITAGQANISGRVRDIDSGEPVVGALLLNEGPGTLGTATDAFGYFSFSMPKGKIELKIKSIGMKTTKRQIMLYGDGKLDIDMKQDIVALREVLIQNDKDANVSRMQMGLEKLDIKSMKQVPSVFGETDVLRVIMALPGVQTVGESSTGLNVRGGATDQNLILFNDATIYNPSHLFGFFSAFNADVIKDVELYKSSIPAEYGGRLSSVLSINSRDGNKKKYTGTAGIGLLTGRLTLEGPIFKDKTSLLLSGRSTYSDWILKQVPNQSIKNSAAGFYDFNAQVTHEVDDKNTIRVSGYYSHDQFKLNGDTLYTYSNKSLVGKWNHIFNNKMYGVFTVAYSGYDFAQQSENNALNAFKLSYNLAQTNVKTDLHYTLGRHFIDFGAAATHYHINPSNFQPFGDRSLITARNLESEKGLETALYAADRFDIIPRFSFYFGLRLSMFNYLGSKKVLNYAPGLPLERNNVLDSTTYGSNQIIKTYIGPEFRISAKYSLTESSSVKLSYNRTRQYINQLSNTTAIAPTDIWKLSDTYLKPQIGDQISLGLYKNLKSNIIETSVEVYYKNIQNAVNFKNGAVLINNPNIETDIVNAQGNSYGAEFLIKKTAGKLNGWVSYTYSRSFVQINDPANATVVNRGSFFPTNYDKPHSFNFIGNYRLSHRFSVSVNVVYSTGRPITLPYTKYQIDGVDRWYFSDRNAYRIPDYFRTDLSLNIDGNHKIKQLTHSSWTIAVYNITGRQNVYSIYFKNENGELRGYSLSVFGVPIPTVTYNCRF